MMDLTKSLTYIHTYIHPLFKHDRIIAQSLWSRVKIITNEYRTILKTGITLLTNATIKAIKMYSKILKTYNVKM